MTFTVGRRQRQNPLLQAFSGVLPLGVPLGVQCSFFLLATDDPRGEGRDFRSGCSKAASSWPLITHTSPLLFQQDSSEETDSYNRPVITNC